MTFIQDLFTTYNLKMHQVTEHHFGLITTVMSHSSFDNLMINRIKTRRQIHFQPSSRKTSNWTHLLCDKISFNMFSRANMKIDFESRCDFISTRHKEIMDWFSINRLTERCIIRQFGWIINFHWQLRYNCHLDRYCTAAITIKKWRLIDCCY